MLGQPQVQAGESVAMVLGLIRWNYFFSNDMACAATAIWCYDYVLVLDREIENVWYTDWSFNKALYFGYRYPGLLNAFIVFFTVPTLPWQTVERCGSLLRLQMAMSIVISVSGTVFAAMRVYALFFRSRALWTVVLLSGLLNPAIFIYIFTRSRPGPSGISTLQGCSLGLTLNITGSLRSYEKGTMIARASSVVSDSIVLVLTLMRIRAKRRDIAGLSKSAHTIRGVLLRNGIICFGLLCIINLVGIATARQTVSIGITQVWIGILTSVLLSRFALDLQEASKPDLASTTVLDTMISMTVNLSQDVTTTVQDPGGQF
ncbi:hypothetical protein FOMPIDRAFT_1162948 [Fomitopsis schrenkii]|uniref:DUF6533 domain-containing protein n=1 Tax=Fomitopsis schrenkii TaxID=2126942 RepID=S8EBC3_FOMSC|nr:hypothetical protein FOMPIDRAFT_1162948 [Fomitopsis schrenkii]